VEACIKDNAVTAEVQPFGTEEFTGQMSAAQYFN
jgi:hypothetical protein